MNVWITGLLVACAAALVTSEIVWGRRVKALFEKQRAAYQGIADAYKAGDVEALEAAEDAALEASREMRALRRWYPWRRL